MIRLVPASLVHVGPIATRMREPDVRECAAMGHSPKQALRLGLQASTLCFTALLNDRPEAMMGLNPTNVLEREGTPWFLGTDEVYRHPRAMLSFAPGVLGAWRDSTRNLQSLVGKENSRAIRLLRRWGFAVGEEVTVVGGMEFVTFSMVD